MKTKSETLNIRINGVTYQVAPNISVAAAIANVYRKTWRRSPSGDERAPFCGMGLCFECRVNIDGVMQRSCQLLVREGMEICCEQ